MEDDFDVGVDVADAVAGAIEFFSADVFSAVEDLALEVREIDDVEVDEAEGSDASGSEVEGDGGAEAAGADAEDFGGFEALLSLEGDFRHDEVPGVACDFVVFEGDGSDAFGVENTLCHA